ncbi:MAG: N-acetylmuramoyl-L-alanine amidase [Flavobacteriales bacterium]|nr:N-acetylmuramoyl-L-alanine amidase [Flavobacteriales bacterium]
MKTAPIADFPHLHRPLVSRRKGMEQRISVMDQVVRRTAGPKSTHVGVGRARSIHGRGVPLLAPWSFEGRNSCWSLVAGLGGKFHGGTATHRPVAHQFPPSSLTANDEQRISITALLKYAAIALLLFALASPVQAQTPGRDPNRIRTVVLDAGHGGKDPGNLGTGRYKTTEKHIAFNVTKLVGKYITENFPDVKVIYTRDDDTFIELKERCNIANKAKADVFISIHCNANDSKDPHGCETYVMGLHKTEANMRVAQKENAAILLEEGHELKYDGYDPKDPESIIALSLRQNTHLDLSLLLSSYIQKQFKDRVGRPDRGVKQAGFLVISYNTMPSVLVELGFLTNANEEDYLQKAEGQDYMASAIYRAFKEYKGTVEAAGSGVPIAELPDTPPVKVEPPVKDETTAEAPSPITFKVQITTSSKRIELKAKNFNGIEGVQEQQGAGLYKYSVGKESTLAGARKLQEECRAKGFDGCFIVAFKDGARIGLQEALKLAEAH